MISISREDNFSLSAIFSSIRAFCDWKKTIPFPRLREIKFSAFHKGEREEIKLESSIENITVPDIKTNTRMIILLKYKLLNLFFGR
jgi:hypothetical protein